LKKLINPRLLPFLFAILLSAFSSKNASGQASVSATITYQTFYDNLSPYGTWIDYPGYGNVWSPKIDEDFRPYATNGYWEYSAEGWTWQSNYSWGWGPFHYGRWLYDDMYGWLWVPGYDWSPAWVTWGNVDNYYCWAPLMPDVNVGADFGSWRPHSFYWNVCSRDHIYDRNISTVMERPERVTNVVNRITIINNFNTTRRNKLYYSKGPDVHEVEGFTKRKVDQVSFREVNKATLASRKGTVVNVYRPTVQVPQPHEFRKVENDQVRPIRKENDDKPSRQRTEQKTNIEHLPVHRINDNGNKNNVFSHPNNNPVKTPTNGPGNHPNNNNNHGAGKKH